MQGIDNRQTIEAYKSLYHGGKISYEELIRCVEPMVQEMNEKGKEIAKKHGKRFTPMTVGYILR